MITRTKTPYLECNSCEHNTILDSTFGITTTLDDCCPECMSEGNWSSKVWVQEIVTSDNFK